MDFKKLLPKLTPFQWKFVRQIIEETPAESSCFILDRNVLLAYAIVDVENNGHVIADWDKYFPHYGLSTDDWAEMCTETERISDLWKRYQEQHPKI